MATNREHPPARRGGIGLSFSGGGFRATAFSLGTLTLLQDLGLLAKAKVMSSVSGGSLALSAYVCAKAGSDAQNESGFDFDDCFYRPLMTFLEQEKLAEAFVNVNALLSGEKLIMKAADATHTFLNQLLNSADSGSEQALLGNEKITEMLANKNLSPDYIFFNATNIASLNLFRFGIQRTNGNNEGGNNSGRGINRPAFVLNRYFLNHNQESAEGKNLYHYTQRIRLADCVAASFCFPAGFEPLIFPDDFIHSDFGSGQGSMGAKEQNTGAEDMYSNTPDEIKNHFRDDLICDRKQYLAFLDGGLYDNLGLASVEDIRRMLVRPTTEDGAEAQPIHFIIATDVDQIPSQYTFYSDTEVEQRLKNKIAKPNQSTSWLIKLFFWLSLRVASLLLRVSALVIRPMITKIKGSTPRTSLGLSASSTHSSLDSWGDVFAATALQLSQDPRRLLQILYDRRVGQLMPAFSGYLKRTRALTYGYLQQTYRGLATDSDCHLIRNMIFELTPGQDVDPDYATNLITLPIENYKHQEKLNPISPIVRKINHAKLVSNFLQCQYRKSASLPLQLRMEDVDLGSQGRYTSLEILTNEYPQAPEGEVWDEKGQLWLDLLTTNTGQLMDEAKNIMEDLNLKQADQIWRWLCTHLSCFSHSDESGGLQVHPESINLPVASTITHINAVLRKQIHENHLLLDQCSVALDESTSSYSWIPLICQMATNVPTTLWLKDLKWYVPDVYKGQKILRNGQWFVDEPSEKDLDGRHAPLNLSELGAAPAAAICTAAGYISTSFNLLEYFYSWLGGFEPAQESLVTELKSIPFRFSTRERIEELENLPYPLRVATWKQLQSEHQQGSLPADMLEKLALLEAPLNRRAGLPDTFWQGAQDD